MPYLLRADTGEEFPLATVRGWGGFGDWLDGVDAGAAPDLVHLHDHGWTDEPGAAAGQLKSALADSPPAGDAAHVAHGLLAALAAIDPDAVATVTDGLGPDDGGPDVAHESRDASGHEHGSDGRFASGGGGGPATADKPDSRPKSALRKSYDLAKAALHAAEAGMSVAMRQTQKVAVAAAKERGLPEEHVARVARVLAAVDWVASFAASKAGFVASGGNAAVGYAAGMMPTASLGYLVYSTARDPKATLRAAKAYLRGELSVPKREGTGAEGAADTRSDAHKVADYFKDALDAGADPDWAEALLFAAMDDDPGDVGAAVGRAAAVLAKQPTQTDVPAAEGRDDDPDDWVTLTPAPAGEGS